MPMRRDIMESIHELKQEVLEANLALVTNKLVISTWGNVSGYDPESGIFVIKASGVPYSALREEHMVAVELSGKIIDTKYRPSSDTNTHRIIYSYFSEKGIRGIVHTHSQYASIWAQLGRALPCFGTTHADYFDGEIPCTEELTDDEILEGYEKYTGISIINAMRDKDPLRVPAAFVIHHGPFAWGETPEKGVMNSVVLEYICKMAIMMNIVDPNIRPLREAILRKHQDRKYGVNAYYGQISKSNQPIKSDKQDKE